MPAGADTNGLTLLAEQRERLVQGRKQHASWEAEKKPLSSAEPPQNGSIAKFLRLEKNRNFCTPYSTPFWNSVHPTNIEIQVRMIVAKKIRENVGG